MSLLPSVSLNTPVIPNATLAVDAPKGVEKTLLKEVGERKLTLTRNGDGTVQLALSPPPVTQMVLSGGGAKGIAFPGVVQALEDKKVLAGINTISGSSAGAISAALLASGMNAKDFETLSNSIDLPELLNSKDPVTAWLQNASSAIGKLAGRLPGPAGSISQILFTLLPRLQTEAQPLEDLIGKESREALLAQIAETPRESRPAEVVKIADKLSAGSGPTFGDLAVLSVHIPSVKQLGITGTGMFDGRPQLVVFNASLTPDLDIARAAHISGSLPVLFKSPTEQGHAFQESGEQTGFQDGGLMVNTPSGGVIDPTAAHEPLSKPEALIVMFESEVSPAKTRGSLKDSIADKVTGTALTAAAEYQAAKLKDQVDQTVVLPLKTEKGDFRGLLNGTVNFTMTDEQKKHLQVLARSAVETHMGQRAEVREQHQFPSLEDAVLAMDDTLLARVEADLQKDPAAHDVLRFRGSAKQALQALDAAIAGANQASDTLTLTPKLSSALRNLDALASRPEQVEWLGRQLNAAGHPNFQQLLQGLSQKPSTEKAQLSRVMTSAVNEMKKRDIAVIAENFTREVIYPSLFRPGQPDSNVALLRQAEYELAQVTTPAEFNQVLDRLIANYGARNKPWSKPFSSTTIEMAKAWRLPIK